MMPRAIIVQAVVGHVCVDPSDGAIVACEAVQPLLAGELVVLDFAGVTTLTGSFLGALVGHLHELAGVEATDSRLAVVGLDEVDRRCFEHTVESSKRLMALSPEKRVQVGEAMQRILET